MLFSIFCLKLKPFIKVFETIQVFNEKHDLEKEDNALDVEKEDSAIDVEKEDNALDVNNFQLN